MLLQHAETALQSTADGHLQKLRGKTAKYSAQAQAEPADTPEDVTDDDVKDLALQTFSKPQHRHLAKLQLQLISANADVAAAKSAAQQLAHPATLLFLNQPGSAVTAIGDNWPGVEGQVTLAVVMLDKVMLTLTCNRPCWDQSNCMLISLMSRR